MSQKTVEKGTKPLASNPASQRSEAPLPGKKQSNNEPQTQVKPATVAAPMSQSSTPAVTTKPVSTPGAAPQQPRTPVPASWPGSATSKPESKPSQPQPIQKAPTSPSVQSASTRVATPQPKAPAPTTTAKPATVAQTAPSSPAKMVTVRFALSKPGSRSAALCGDFNSWSPDATPMTRKESGCWEATLALRPGRYQYKFVVDGEWLHDPNALKNVPNQHGSLNSVMEV